MFKVEVVVVEVAKMVEVVKAAVMKDIIRRRDSRVKQIGVEEDYSNIQCYKCKKYGHYANDYNFDNCYNCGKMGHFARDCRAEKKVEETTNLALEDVTNEGLLLMAQSEDNINNDTLWYLDSGASNHMCGHEYLFKEMQKVEESHVSFEVASKVEVRYTSCKMMV